MTQRYSQTDRQLDGRKGIWAGRKRNVEIGYSCSFAPPYSFGRRMRIEEEGKEDRVSELLVEEKKADNYEDQSWTHNAGESQTHGKTQIKRERQQKRRCMKAYWKRNEEERVEERNM